MRFYRQHLRLMFPPKLIMTRPISYYSFFHFMLARFYSIFFRFIPYAWLRSIASIYRIFFGQLFALAHYSMYMDKCFSHFYDGQIIPYQVDYVGRRSIFEMLDRYLFTCMFFFLPVNVFLLEKAIELFKQ
jgi:hypothetical protein